MYSVVAKLPYVITVCNKNELYLEIKGNSLNIQISAVAQQQVIFHLERIMMDE